ncbi:histidine phosphatase family protein [Bacteroidales bacterium OttesenSCG-928-I21]|nr:histidine phosphatase family protein [Bacteroidales bacterium OttesenSCG-928-I21]
MKLLTLIRHAKAGTIENLSDFDRPLNEKGCYDAEKIGEYLNKNLSKPDLIISSPALRAVATAEKIAQIIGYPADKIKYIDELYLCSTSEYIEVLLEQSVKIRHIFVVSHNPGTTNFVNLLTNENIDDIPTCGAAHIEIDIYKWEDIEPGTGSLKKLITPKNI